MGVRIIALGQRAAGDDGVGLVVIDRLRAVGVPDGAVLHEIAEATAMIPLLETRDPVVVIDAIVGPPCVGELFSLSPEHFAARGLAAYSTHGVGAIEAIELARALSGDRVSPSIRIVGIVIDRPMSYRQQLSPAVARAVPGAVASILAMIGESHA